MIFVVWKGHRDCEEDVAAFPTREAAETYLAENGVELRDDPAPQVNTQSLMGADFTPWGIVEIPYFTGDRG